VKEGLIFKNEDLRQKIVNELEATITILKQEEQRAEIELMKTGLNTVNKFHLNKAKDDIQLLIKTLTALENTVKGHTPDDHELIDS